jgi:hypothetical protein
MSTTLFAVTEETLARLEAKPDSISDLESSKTFDTYLWQSLPYFLTTEAEEEEDEDDGEEEEGDEEDEEEEEEDEGEEEAEAEDDEGEGGDEDEDEEDDEGEDDGEEDDEDEDEDDEDEDDGEDEDDEDEGEEEEEDGDEDDQPAHPLDAVLIGDRSVKCRRLENGAFHVITAPRVAELSALLAAVKPSEIKRRVLATDLEEALDGELFEELEQLDLTDPDEVAANVVRDLKGLVKFYAAAARQGLAIVLYTT